MSIIEYYSKMRTITNNLATVGSGITKDDLLMYFYGGLDLEFDSVVVMITGRDELVDLNSIVSLLLTHECRPDQQNVSCSNDTRENFSTNYVQVNHNQKKKNELHMVLILEIVMEREKINRIIKVVTLTILNMIKEGCLMAI